jgi:hypothetical protein
MSAALAQYSPCLGNVIIIQNMKKKTHASTCSKAFAFLLPVIPEKSPQHNMLKKHVQV